MQQLSGHDSLYLYLDNPRQPIQVDSVMIFDAATSQKRIDFPAFKELIATKLHVSRIFRQRLVQTPLKLDYPYWIEDPDFDLDLHLHHIALPKPGGWKELCEIQSHVFSMPLDRSRPLWEMVFIDGLDQIEGVAPDSFAVIMKIHHVAIDGVSGAQIMDGLLDKTSTYELPEVQDTWKPETIPEDKDLLKQVLVNSLKKPKQVLDFISQLSTDAEKLTKFLKKEKMRLKDLVKAFDPPITRFGAMVTPHRIWDAVSFPLKEVRAIGKAMSEDVTINDVVLTICSAALRQYLREKNELPDRPLVVQIPVSVRQDHEKHAMGNRISVMSAQLATTEADPAKRLEVMHKNAKFAKEIYQQSHPERLRDSMQILPNIIGDEALAFYHMTQKDLKWPIYFNLAVTNIPGPREILYARGTQLKSIYFAGPPVDGIGLFIGVFSYAGHLTISAASCREMMPDVEKFAQLLRSSFEELHAIYLK